MPAILRYNRIPARVLVEVCNLNNPEDRQLLVTRAFREKVARSLVGALVEFYGERGGTIAEGAGVSPRKATQTGSVAIER